MSSTGFDYAKQYLFQSPDVALFALVDGLQYERFFGDELPFQQNVSMPLFEKYPDSRVAFAGPWLIRISEMASVKERLTALETEFPSVSWLVSTSTLSELITHFQRYMNVVLPDGQMALLRFQDPRVQVRLGDVFNIDQHIELTCLTMEWIIIIEGKLYSLKQKRFICQE